jgi:hypothetical protein
MSVDKAAERTVFLVVMQVLEGKVDRAAAVWETNAVVLEAPWAGRWSWCQPEQIDRQCHMGATCQIGSGSS